MGIKRDLRRYRRVGEDRRLDLSEFIEYGDLGKSRSDQIRIPIKIIDLPAFEYDRRAAGGVGQGTDDSPQPGDVIEPGVDDDAAGAPGSEDADHEYYDMDPDEFSKELDDELGLSLEPKGKRTTDQAVGSYTDLARTGPSSTLALDHLFKAGLKRKLAVDFDEEYVRAFLGIEGMTPERAFRILRERNVPVSLAHLKEISSELSPDEREIYSTLESFDAAVEYDPVATRIRREGLGTIPFRRNDERYRYPEVEPEPSYDVVVVNIRDASGSMREEKRELVERIFTPLDWYLQGKYDRAEFVYILHDATAWEVDRTEFFGIKSSGGTRISAGYELVRDLLAERYPWDRWNRYIFAAGDSENSSNDTEDRVIPLMREIEANLHAYVETQPGGGAVNATHAETVDRELGNRDDVAVCYVSDRSEITDAIYTILSTDTEP